ncbi:MAG: TetR/AcrR family transcriptional regulator [Myxococcota bacterium]
MSEHVITPGERQGPQAKRTSSRSGKAKRQDPAEVRRRLVTAATQRFASHGFEGVNSNQIARDAGVGVGTFYHHFQDKREVHQAVVLETLEALQNRVAAQSARAPDAPLEDQVRDLVEVVVGFAEEIPAQFRVAFGGDGTAGLGARPQRTPLSGAAPGRAQVGYSTRATERRLAALQAKGVLDPRLDPGVAARAFVGMQNSVLCWWLEDPTRATREAIVETLFVLHPAIAAANSNVT